MSIEQWWSREPVRRQLEDLLDTGSLARDLVSRGRPAFDADRVLQAAGEALVIRTGEACQRLPAELTSAYPTVPWREIIGMRRVVAPTHRIVDPAIVWSVLADGLPDLIETLGLRGFQG